MAQSDDPAERAKEIQAQAEALQAQAAALQAEAEALKKAESLQAQAAALQAEADALRQSTTTAQPPVEAPVERVPAQPVVPQQQPQYVVQAAPVKQKGNGGLIGWLVTLSVLLLASLAAIALIFFGIVNPRALLGLDGEGVAAPVVTGTPTTTYFAPAMAAGANAFAADVSTMVDDSAVLAADVDVEGTEASAAPVPSVGDTAGLYGLSAIGCSRTALATKLAEDPATAEAWAAAASADSTIAWEGGTLAPEDIQKYLYTMTAFTLVSDTWVVDHGNGDGAAADTPVLLQKGTAVLVDRLGMPRVRCISGNPLSAPAPDTAPVYSGTGWEDFAAESVVSVTPADSILTDFSVSLPARLTGSVVPVRAYPCTIEVADLLCSEPGPALTMPEFPNPTPVPDGVTVPAIAECANFPPNNADWVNVTYRLYNVTDADMYLYWTNNTQDCGLDYLGTYASGEATNGSVNAAPIGGLIYVADAAGNVLDKVSIEGFTLKEIK